jgi:hypothetical protein
VGTEREREREWEREKVKKDDYQVVFSTTI